MSLKRNFRGLVLFLGAIMSLLFKDLPSHAGGMDSGGGRSVVCRDSKGKITSAELLDLYEGRIQFGLKIRSSQDDFQAQILKAEAIYKSGTREDLKYLRSSVFNHFKFLPKKAKLALVDDSHEFILPSHCRIEQAAHFINPELILIDTNIWNKMSPTNKAALVVHETLYWKERLLGATNSRHTRFVTAHLFAKDVIFEDIYEGIPENALICMGFSKKFGEIGNQMTLIYVYPEKVSNNWILQFRVLGGKEVVSKKTASVDLQHLGLENFKSVEVGTDHAGESIRTLIVPESKLEGGDNLILGLEKEKVPDANFTWNRITLTGSSGWDPSLIYDKAYFSCSSTNTMYRPPPK